MIHLSQNLSYCNKNQEMANQETDTHKAKPKETSDIVIQIVEEIESEPNSLRQTLRSDFFVLVALAKKTRITDLQRFKKAIGSKIEKCVSGIFVPN